ncbi:MAG: hypothetical protein KatS3mg053_1834 [Candidatus Roseilinea sp.]|nr:MAG: hypothetical protein KatS3mg053_1834 [Candidatus Roseilinea sp.]
MPNLMEVIGSMITPSTVNQIASLTGEDSNGITKALGTIVPTLITAAAAKGSTSSGAQQLINSIGSLIGAGTGNGDIASLLGGGEATQNLLKTGSVMANALLGSNANAITDVISSASGVSNKSVSSLMAIGAPLLASVISKTLGAGNVNPTSLSNLLAEQGQYVKDTLPPEVNRLLNPAVTTARTSVTEPSPASRVETYTRPPVTEPPRQPEPQRSFWSWLLPLLGVLALGLLVFAFCNRPQPVDNTVACNAIARLDQTIASVPTVTADTRVADVKDFFTKVRDVHNTIGPAAQALTGVNLSGLNTAFNALDSIVNGLAGDVVGDAADTINRAVTDIKSQNASLRSSVGCR